MVIESTRLLTTGYARQRVAVAMVLLTLASGLLYLWLQNRLTGNICNDEELFVSMLVAATIILLQGTRRLQRFVVRESRKWLLLPEPDGRNSAALDRYEQLCHHVLHHQRMTVVGLLYGLALGSSVAILKLWPDEPTLAWSLALFMFFVNFATGVAIYSLAAFLVQVVKLGRGATVNLWQPKSPSTVFLLRAARRVSILAAIYAALANSSLLFSVFPINAWTIGYFCFAGLVVLLSLVVPPLPVVLKLEAAKEAALEGIDRQVHLSFYRNTADSTQRREDIDYEKVKTLIELREKIEAISTWPFRLRTVSAGLSVILFSSVPVVIQILAT